MKKQVKKGFCERRTLWSSDHQRQSSTGHQILDLASTEASDPRWTGRQTKWSHYSQGRKEIEASDPGNSASVEPTGCTIRRVPESSQEGLGIRPSPEEGVGPSKDKGPAVSETETATISSGAATASFNGHLQKASDTNRHWFDGLFWSGLMVRSGVFQAS